MGAKPALCRFSRKLCESAQRSVPSCFLFYPIFHRQDERTPLGKSLGVEEGCVLLRFELGAIGADRSTEHQGLHRAELNP
jgi:hypothetical protein